VDSAELAAAVLPRTRFRDGFAIDEVDALIERCVEALRACEQGRPSPIAPEEIVRAQFRHVRFREAYDADAVDDLLDSVVARLRELEPERASAVPRPSAAPTSEQLAKARRFTIGMRVVTVVVVLVAAAMFLWKLLGA